VTLPVGLNADNTCSPGLCSWLHFDKDVTHIRWQV